MKELIVQADSLPRGNWEKWRPKVEFLAIEANSFDQMKYRDAGTPQYALARRGEFVVFEKQGDAPAVVYPALKFHQEYDLGKNNRAIPKLRVSVLLMNRPFRIKGEGQDICGEPGEYLAIFSDNDSPVAMTFAELEDAFVKV